MAFNTQFRIKGASDIFGLVTINVKKDGYTGFVKEFDGAGRDFCILKIGEGGNDISLPILSSTLSVSFYSLNDFEAISLGNSEPFTYLVEVLTQTNGVIWSGYVMPESYEEEYTNTPYLCSFVASDNLDYLKSVAYPFTDVFDDSSALQIVRNCLINTGLELRLLDSVNTFDVLMSQELGALEQMTLDLSTFAEKNANCYEVLQAVLSPFFSRVYQYEGWRVENITSKRDNHGIYLYDKFGVFVGVFNSLSLREFNNSETNFNSFVGKSGELNFEPSINKAKVYFPTVSNKQEQVLKGFDKQTDWVSTSELEDWENKNGITIQRVVTEYNGNTFAVRIAGKQTNLSSQQYIESKKIPVLSDSNKNITIAFEYKMNYPSLILFGEKPTLFFQAYLQGVTKDWYYNGTDWVDSNENSIFYYMRISASPRNQWRSFTTNIDSLPENGDLIFRFYRLVKSGSTGNTELFLTNFQTSLQFQDNTLNVFNVTTGRTEIATNIKAPSFEFFFGDFTEDIAGVIKVGEDFTSEWSLPDPNDTTGLDLHSLFVNQWLSFHQRPTATLKGQFKLKGADYIKPFETVKDKDEVSGTRYIMTAWETSLGSGFANLQYREILQDYVDPLNIAYSIESQISSDDYLIRGNRAQVGSNDFNPDDAIPLDPSQIITYSPQALNGDVTGEISTVQLTPSAIVNKEILDTSSIVSSRVVLNAVEDTEDNEVMSKTSAKDLLTSWDVKTAYNNNDTLTLSDSEDDGELKTIKVSEILENHVPYSGATDNVDLGEYGLKSGYLALDTTPTNTPTTQGTMYWDVDDNTVAMIMNGTIQKIGEDSFYPVKNQTGSNIPKGTAVRFAGTLGMSGRLLIAPFLANGSFPSITFMGVTSEDIANGEDGKVQWFGRIRGINTNAFNQGDILYASPTVAGGFTTTPPQAPNNIISVCAVITKSTTVGTIFVRPQIGSNINNDEGVKIVSPINGNLLQLQSNGLWENKTLAQVLGGNANQFVKGNGSLDSTLYVPTTRTLTINGQTFDLSANRTWTIPTHDAVTIGTANGLSLAGQAISLGLASASTNGALSSTDWNTFNNKQNALTNPITGTGVNGRVAFWNGTNTQTSDSGLVWDNVNKRLGVGTSTPIETVSIYQNSRPYISFQNATTGTTTNDGMFFGHAFNDLDFEIRNKENSQITIWTNNTTRWSILSTGILQSNGAQTIQTSTGALRLETGGGNGNIILMPNGSGNVGIGTNAPSGASGKTFAIFGASGQARFALKNNATTDNASAGFQFALTESGDAIIEQRGNFPLRFSANSTEFMRLNPNGSFLINTISPLTGGGRLQVNGNINIATVTNATGDFLTHVNGLVNKRTASQVRTDIGAQIAGNYVTTDTTQDITALKTINIDLPSQLNLFNPTNASGKTVGMRLATPSWAVRLQTSQNTDWLQLTDDNSVVFHGWNGSRYYPGASSLGGSLTGYITGNGTNIYIGKTSDDGIGKFQVSGVITSNNLRVTTGEGVTNHWTGTQAQYDAIGTKSATTIYYIV